MVHIFISPVLPSAVRRLPSVVRLYPRAPPAGKSLPNRPKMCTTLFHLPSFAFRRLRSAVLSPVQICGELFHLPSLHPSIVQVRSLPFTAPHPLIRFHIRWQVSQFVVHFFISPVCVSHIADRESLIAYRQSKIENPKSAIPNPQSPVSSLQSPVL